MTAELRAREECALIPRELLAITPPEERTVSSFRIDGTPVVVVDSVYRHPDVIRSLALSLEYRHRIGAYPGRFAAVSLPNRDLLALAREVYEVEAGSVLDFSPFYRDVWFAIVTDRGGELAASQGQPHVDAFAGVAGVVYLNPPTQCRGGTSFWSHRETGLRAEPRDDDPRMKPLLRRLSLEDAGALRAHCLQRAAGDADSGSLTESNETWELSELVEMRFNRMVLYDSKLFHMPHYDERWFGDALEERRLTQNVYLDRRPGGPGDER